MIRSIVKIALRGLIHYRLQHLLMAAGVAIVTMVIGGALLIGDSVNQSLYRLMSNRLGRIESAVKQDKIFFRSSVTEKFGGGSAAVIHLNAYMITGNNTVKVNLYGVSSDFFRLSSSGSGVGLSPGVAMLNRTASNRFTATANDAVILRLLNPTLSSNYQMLSPGKNMISIRLNYGGIIDSGQLGDFSMQNSQEIPLNVFVEREYLAGLLGLHGKCNWLLTPETTDIATLDQRWKKIIAPEDLGWVFDPITPGFLELKSNHIFLNQTVLNAITAAGFKTQKMLAGFAGNIKTGSKSVPYSFVSGIEAVNYSEVDEKCPNLWASDWLAEDLSLKTGDIVTVNFLNMSQTMKLKEIPVTFRVAGFYRMDDNQLLRSLSTDFPGIADSRNCRDWDPGIALEYSSIRPKDEEFWRKYRNAPKAIIPYSVAVKIWGSPSETATTCRLYPCKSIPEVFSKIMNNLPAADLNLGWQPVRKYGILATGGAINFGSLFLGLSIVIIFSVVVLLMLLTKLNIAARKRELITMYSCGWSVRNVMFVKLSEYGIVAITGVTIGLVLMIGYSYCVFIAISTIWRESIAGTVVVFTVLPESLLIAWCVSLFISLLVIGITFYSNANVAINNSQSVLMRENNVSGIRKFYSFIPGGVVFIIGITSAFSFWFCNAPIWLYFPSSLIVLAGMLISCKNFINLLPALFCHGRNGIFIIGIRNLPRKYNNSMAAVCMFSIGIFLVAAVGVNRQGIDNNTARRDSGTGGFKYYAKTTLPVIADLNTMAGKKRYKLKDAGGLKFVAAALKDGEEASCLNLNQVFIPSLLGVNPEDLTSRNAFSFSSLMSDKPGWDCLNGSITESNEIPTVADMAVIQWSLHKKIGDSIEYPGSGGKMWKLKLVGGLNNCILQGSLIVSMENFKKMFPEINGYNVFLIDDNINPDLKNIRAKLSGLEYSGLYLETAGERLQRYCGVQNTYLQIFLALGALGLLIGTAGVGVIVLRNIAERQSELAWLSVAGYSRTAIAIMLFSENFIIVLLSVFCSLPAIGIILLPGFISMNVNIPWLEIAVFFVSLIAVAGMVIAASSYYAIRKSLVRILINE